MKEVEVLNVDGEVMESNMIIPLSKEYQFEGQSYMELDLRGLNDLTASDMIDANRILSRSGNIDFLPEMTLEYACILAAKAAKQPIEFFKGLPPRDAMKIKNRITGFLYGSE